MFLFSSTVLFNMLLIENKQVHCYNSVALNKAFFIQLFGFFFLLFCFVVVVVVFFWFFHVEIRATISRSLVKERDPGLVPVKSHYTSR